MWLFAGLGNPGPQYAKTRHNVGFMAVDAIAQQHGFSSWAKKFRGQWCEGSIGGEKVFLLKPQTFMNLSGEAVGEACRFYKIPPERVVVFHDELDLPLAEVKIKQSGGNAGHNGLRSIDAAIGKDYLRVRIGIGKPREAIAHVLDNFSNDEMKSVDAILAYLADHAFEQITHFLSIGARNLKIKIGEGNQVKVSASAEK
jgi:peptidyl-tRNA hydrolase, PTH1 family